MSGTSTPVHAVSCFPRNCPDSGINRYEVSTGDTDKYERLIRPHIDLLIYEMSDLLSRGIGRQVKVTYVDEKRKNERPGRPSGE